MELLKLKSKTSSALLSSADKSKHKIQKTKGDSKCQGQEKDLRGGGSSKKLGLFSSTNLFEDNALKKNKSKKSFLFNKATSEPNSTQAIIPTSQSGALPSFAFKTQAIATAIAAITSDKNLNHNDNIISIVCVSPTLDNSCEPLQPRLSEPDMQVNFPESTMATSTTETVSPEDALQCLNTNVSETEKSIPLFEQKLELEVDANHNTMMNTQESNNQIFNVEVNSQTDEDVAYLNFYSDVLPSAPVKSDSEAEVEPEPEPEPIPKSKPLLNKTDIEKPQQFLKNEIFHHHHQNSSSQETLISRLKGEQSSTLTLVSPEKVVAVYDAEETIKENLRPTETKESSPTFVSHQQIIPSEIIKIKPFVTSFSKTSAFSKMKTSPNFQIQKPLQPMNLNSTSTENNNSNILNSYVYESVSSNKKCSSINRKEQILLKISWEQLARDFDLLELNDLDDNAFTSIQYYNMILREDLLPPRSRSQVPDLSCNNSKNAHKDALSKENSENITISGQNSSKSRSSILEIGSTKKADSMANLYSGTSLINRKEAHIVHYTDETVCPCSCPCPCTQHVTTKNELYAANTIGTKTEEDNYRVYAAANPAPAPGSGFNLNCPNSSHNYNSDYYHACNNYSNCYYGQSQSSISRQCNNYCYPQKTTGSAYSPLCLQNGQCGHPVQPTSTLHKNGFDLTLDSLKQSALAPGNGNYPTGAPFVNSTSEILNQEPSAITNGSFVEERSAGSASKSKMKFENVFTKTRKALGRAKSVIVSSFTFGGHASTTSKPRNCIVNGADGFNINVHQDSSKTKAGTGARLRTKGTLQLKKDSYCKRSYYKNNKGKGKIENKHDVNSCQSSSLGEEGKITDNLSTCTLSSSQIPYCKINQYHVPLKAILAPGISSMSTSSPGQGQGGGRDQLQAQQHSIINQNQNKALWTTTDPKSLDNVYNFDYFYQHYLKEENTKHAS